MVVSDFSIVYDDSSQQTPFYRRMLAFIIVDDNIRKHTREIFPCMTGDDAECRTPSWSQRRWKSLWGFIIMIIGSSNLLCGVKGGQRILDSYNTV